MDLAEDVIQDAMVEALNQWSYNGVPENPIGWIYKVARFKAINQVNRDQYKKKYAEEARHLLSNEDDAIDNLFTEKEIADDQLRMMFACCHPSLSPDSQIALTLKTLCGFSIPEIARTFLTTTENINKRLVRARKLLKQEEIAFEVPVGKDLEPRLTSVLETIYLLFNEGYHASTGSDLIRYELCEEAIRITKIITENSNFEEKSRAQALLALMLLNASRFKSRTDNFRNMVDLEHQDREKWNRDFISEGLYYLEMATKGNQVSTFHIMAAISAHYCTAPDFKSTDWKSILELYDHLIKIERSPIVLLNRSVIIAQVYGPEKALTELDDIAHSDFFKRYLPYYITKAAFLEQTQKKEEAITLLKQALSLSTDDNSRNEIQRKLEQIASK